MADTNKQYMTSYKYDCELEFHASNGEAIKKKKEGFKYLFVSHNYSDAVMPIMYLNINLFANVYNGMVPDQGKGKLYLKLSAIKQYGKTSTIYKTIVEEEFDYFMTDDPNTYIKLDDIKGTEKLSYRTCFIGLMKLDLQKKNRKMFEGIFKNTNSMSLIQSATANFKMVIQPFDYNKNFDQFICPTITSIGKFIAYLNSKAAFYKGSYMYYMDLDRTYLRSNDGSYIDAKDGDYNIVSFNIKNVLDDKSVTTGMIEDPKNKSYIVYLSGDEAHITVNRISNNLVGLVTGINTASGASNSTMVSTEEVTGVKTVNSVTMQTSIDDNAASNLSTRLEENSVALHITKIDMNTKVFTPNKQFLLSNYDNNPKYCGKYYMTKKEELYMRTGDQILCQMNVSFNKCAEK